MNSLKEVMCKRQDLGMTWPDYVWLVLNFDDKTFMKTSCKDQIIVFWYYMKLSRSNTKVQIDYNKLIDISAPDYKNSKKIAYKLIRNHMIFPFICGRTGQCLLQTTVSPKVWVQLPSILFLLTYHLSHFFLGTLLSP